MKFASFCLISLLAGIAAFIAGEVYQRLWLDVIAGMLALPAGMLLMRQCVKFKGWLYEHGLSHRASILLGLLFLSMLLTQWDNVLDDCRDLFKIAVFSGSGLIICFFFPFPVLLLVMSWVICFMAMMLHMYPFMWLAAFIGLLAVPKCGAIFYRVMVHGNMQQHVLDRATK